MEQKFFLKSKTIWFNFIMFCSYLLPLIDFDYFKTNYTHFYLYLSTFNAAVNAYLRFITNKAITFTKNIVDNNTDTEK